MRYLAAAGRIAYRSIEVILLLVSMWMIFAHLLSQVRVNSDFVPSKNGIPIYLRSNGVHTDFVVPVRSDIISWDAVVRPSDFNADSTYSHLAFGWGNKRFYLNTPEWKDLTFSTAFTAAFGLGEAAMHITYYKAAPQPGVRVKSFVINEEQYQNLVNYILKYLRDDHKGVMIIDHPGYGAHDRFYEANGTYNMFLTCNEWTGNGMQETGLPVGVWTPLEAGIMGAR